VFLAALAPLAAGASALGSLAVPLMIGGTILSAVGSITSGLAQNAASKANARALKQQATLATQRAALAEAQSRRRSQRLLATQRAGFAAAGVTATGTPLLVAEDTVEQAELDALTIRFGGATEAASLRTQARIERFQGKQAVTSGILGAGTTLLTNFGQIGQSLLPAASVASGGK
jgi:hypothetical protein